MQLHVGAWAAEFDDDGILWISDFTYNGLYKYDFEKKELYFVHQFKNVSISQDTLHNKMCIRGDEIFLFPLKDNGIRIFNKKSLNEVYINIPSKKDKRFEVALTEKKAWIFSDVLDEDILCFDLETKDFSPDVKLNDFCKKTIGKKDGTIKKGNYDNSLILLEQKKKKVYCLNVDTYQYMLIDISSIKESIEKVYFLKNKYWFLFRESHDIVAYDMGKRVYVKYTSAEAEYLDGKNIIPYANMVEWENELLILNYYGKYITRINEEKQIVEKMFSNELEMITRDDVEYGACYMVALKEADSLFFIPQRAKEIIEISRKFEILNKYECATDRTERELQEIVLLKQQDLGVLKENQSVVTLQRYITNIFQRQSNVTADDNIGRRIYLQSKADAEEKAD